MLARCACFLVVPSVSLALSEVLKGRLNASRLSCGVNSSLLPFRPSLL